MGRISVIVPVYKVEAYLSRCVDSVLTQTFSDFNLILVDDGSPDGCPVICDAYAEKDSRIHVIHQKNAGLSAARNAAIDYVMCREDSDYITFLDSDDWLHQRTLETLLGACESLHCAVAVCRYQRTGGEDPQVETAMMKPQLRDARSLYLEETILMTVACAKLYRKECFREIRFPVGKLHEDEFTTYRVLFQQESLAYVPAPLYAYFENPESITKCSWSERRLDAWQAFQQQIDFFEERNDKALADHCLRRYLYNANNQYLQIQELENPGQFRRSSRMIKRKIDSLISEAQKRGCLDFDGDFGLLHRMHPWKTNLRLYGRAVLRRLKGKKNA